MIVKDFINQFEELFPQHLAYNWDNVGLQLGSKELKISNILLSLDLTIEVIDEAIENNCNLIVCHHPMIFSPLKNIITDSYQGSMINKLLKNDISIYVAHTNFDIGNSGMNKILADMLDLQNQQIIEMTTETEGLGRFGTLDDPRTLRKFINDVKRVFNLDSVRVVGDLDKVITTVAISGGSGSTLLSNPIMNMIDLYITGDISYHHALDALNQGITILDVGHNIEKHSLSELKNILDNMKSSSEVLISKIDTNPYLFR